MCIYIYIVHTHVCVQRTRNSGEYAIEACCLRGPEAAGQSGVFQG